MDTPRLTIGDLIASAGAAVLVVSLFLPWYGVSVDVAGFSKSDSGTGREVLSSIDMVLFLISVAVIAVVAARAAGGLLDRPQARVIMVSLGALALLLVLYRIVDIPTDGHVPAHVELSRKVGIFIALAGAAAVAYGGWRPVHKGRRRPEGRAAVGGLELSAGGQRGARRGPAL